MKKRLLSLVALVSLVLALSFPVAVPAAPPAPKPSPAMPAAAPERHPQIRAAMGSLRQAREHLEHADHDFGGHRVEAIRAIDAALDQLQACLQYDK
jgi:outer membrane protein TolC